MKRRGFLKLLGLLPFAPKAAEAALEVAAMAAVPAPLKFMGCPVVVDPGLGDQTSIWLVGWSEPGHKVTSRSSLPAISYKRDMKQIARVANIDVSALRAPGKTRMTHAAWAARLRDKEDDLFLNEVARGLERSIFYESKPKRNWLKEMIRGC